MTEKSTEAITLTRRIAREIQQKKDIVNNTVLYDDDLNKVKTGFSINLTGNTKNMQLRELYNFSKLGL